METLSLWPDIEHAEECLVSGIYEEAAAGARSTLQTLSGEVWDGVCSSPLAQNEPPLEGDDSEEVGSMVEAAGMVLLQALSQMGRPCNLYAELIAIFHNLGRVPYSLILTGTCLQISLGFDPEVQTAIEEYLSGWRSPEDGSDGVMVKTLVLPMDASASEGVAETRKVYLSEASYLQLTEIYAVEALAKLKKSSAGAHLWIQNASISREQKQVILERLQQVVSESQTPSGSSGSKHGAEAHPNPKTVGEPLRRTQDEAADMGSSEQDVSSSVESSQATEVPPTPNSERSMTKVVKGSAFWGFPLTQTVMRLFELVMLRLSATGSSKWIATQKKRAQSELLWTGAFASIIVYAILRKRQFLSRRVMDLVRLSRVCLSDLWRLAFSVHLNPLVAG